MMEGAREVDLWPKSMNISLVVDTFSQKTDHINCPILLPLDHDSVIVFLLHDKEQSHSNCYVVYQTSGFMQRFFLFVIGTQLVCV